jgi:AAA domain, putative AbiEii toxin, Type IV TA system/AAA ATPase domain
MIHSLSINGYRAFSRLELGGLGWVNLLVGRNNSGKSSVLEALYLHVSGGDPTALWRVVSRRGERIDTDPVARAPDVELDLSHLFHGHDLKVGSKFSVSTKNGASATRSIEFSIMEATSTEHPELFGPEPLDGTGVRLILSIAGNPRPVTPTLFLTVRGSLSSDALSTRRLRRSAVRNSSAFYITTESLSVDELVRMWNDVVLTESEKMIEDALRFVEPNVERVASSNIGPSFSYGPPVRGGFKVKLKNVAQPIPIGSLGDGTWRLLAMAIALGRARNGVLLIDEIDTGLHHTVMTDMWRLVYESARRFNIQVFYLRRRSHCKQRDNSTDRGRSTEGDPLHGSRDQNGRQEEHRAALTLSKGTQRGSRWRREMTRERSSASCNTLSNGATPKRTELSILNGLVVQLSSLIQFTWVLYGNLAT